MVEPGHLWSDGDENNIQNQNFGGQWPHFLGGFGVRNFQAGFNTSKYLTIFGLRNLTFGRVILLKLFDPSNSFEVIVFKIGIFLKNYLQNCGPDQKV